MKYYVFQYYNFIFPYTGIFISNFSFGGDRGYYYGKNFLIKSYYFILHHITLIHFKLKRFVLFFGYL